VRPLDRIGSIKLKLGVLVAVAVAVAAVLPTAAARAGVGPWLAIPATVAVALVVTQLLARGMTSPLREMTAAARSMATGDYTRRVHAGSRDEVGELARAFNRMAADLEAVDRHRRDLVASVSHELRTPVSALQAVLENLVDGVAAPDRATLETALQQTVRLGRLVSDLLDLSRVDAGIVPLAHEPVACEPFLRAAVEEARMVGRDVEYAVDVRPPDLVLHGDPARLHQLVANLLDNAGRHSPAGATVHVRARRETGRVVLEVVDEGPGIPEQDRSAVFERFTTGATSDGGTGLGLAIARWITDLHRGSIAVADAPHGCRIRAAIPQEETT
jgi:signal transduction histidine kinase